MTSQSYTFVPVCAIRCN